MRRVDPGTAYIAAVLFAPEGSEETRQERSNTQAAWPWAAVLVLLALSSLMFGLSNPELLATVWNLM